MQIFDCVIIGGGAAGMTAALYLKRANLNVTIIEKGAPGGKLNNIFNIENYPGFPSVSGSDLAQNMYEQITNIDVVYKYGDVLEIQTFEDYKVIKTDIEEIKSKTVIIASGRVPRKLGLKNEEELIGRGVGFCALCDGSFYKDKIVAVAGGGNSALEDAIYLSNICKTVIIIHRRDYFTAEATTQEKLKSIKNIEIKYKSTITELITDDNKLSKIKINSTNKKELVEVDGLFINIGYIPDTNYLISSGINLENDYIVVDEGMRTNIRKIYACGDVIKKSVYQITTAIAEGTVAANSVQKDIN